VIGTDVPENSSTQSVYFNYQSGMTLSGIIISHLIYKNIQRQACLCIINNTRSIQPRD